MKRLTFLIAFMAISFFIYAQQSVKGKVFDAYTGAPLSGASISYNGGGTTTDKDGSFSVACEKAGRIEVSFVGYETYSRTIRNCNEELSISLKPAGGTLDEVEITATSNQNKSLLYQPVSITKLNKTELKRGTGLFLDDAINANVPGVTMNRRAVSSGQQFNIRGYGNGVRGTNGVSSNFDGQGYKVYLNGIPITDAEGLTLMDDIDFGSIGNVEVVKGPAGTLYGLAIAGVVNLHTIKPEKGKTSIGQEVLIGNYGLKRFTTHFQMGGERSSILLNYGYQESDGFMTHAKSEKRFINLAGDFQPNDKQSISFYAGYSDSYDERGGELTLDQYKNKDYTGNPAYIMRNAHSEIISFRVGVGHTYNFNSHISNTTSVFGTGIANNASSAAGWTDKDPINYGVRSVFNTKFEVGNNISLSGITGVEAQRQHAQVIGYFMKADAANPTGYFKIDTMRSNQQYITSTTSLFTEWTLSLPKDFSITAGVGMSTMKIDLNDRFIRPNINRPMHFEKRYNDMISPHVAINKVFSKELSVYASYSKGYKAPVSSYFFVPVSATNAFIDSTLKPEIGNQFEVGSKGSLFKDKLQYQLAAFHTEFSNKMTAVAVPLDPPNVGTAYSYVANGGKHVDNGIEALVKFTAYQSGSGFFRLIRPFANATYSDFEYEDYKIERLKNPATSDTTIDYSGKPVAGVAKFMGNLGVDVYTGPGIYLNVVYSYKDGVPITSDNLFNSAAYSLLNAKIGIQQHFAKHFDIDAYFGAQNITETQYPLMIFVNQLPDAYLPAPLKAVYFGGINLKYNF
jgi:iron complex outermembrane receptor protein